MGNKMTKKEFTKKIFDKYDTNKNNSIDQGEMKIFIRKILDDSGYSNVSDYTLEVYIEKWDKDGNGKLSRHEVKEVLEHAWENTQKK